MSLKTYSIDKMSFETKQNKEIVTPICKVYKKVGPDSKRDYKEQKKRVRNEGLYWMWDDNEKNKAKIGDRFGFVRNGMKVKWHKVLDVKNPTERLPTWARNVGQTNRNVLILSNVLEIESWDDFTDRRGYNKNFCIRGTMYLKSK